MKLLLVLAVYFILIKCGLNPFWSVLVIIYWRGILKLSLFLGGVVYILNLIMY